MVTSQGLLLRRYRCSLLLFLAGLVLSGVTAFPLQKELELAAGVRGVGHLEDATNGVDRWIVVVRDGLRQTYSSYPWVAYGTDWLAFAHLVIAVLFIGPYVDPLRNKWVIQAGLVLCAGVIPLALIAGEVRGIPLGWRMIDCSFGVGGALPLLYCLHLTRRMERLSEPEDS